MMEEGSEAHMETDVTSTTEDVPETEEVTGSTGNVEMVLIVEKVTEGENSGHGEAQQTLNTTNKSPSPQKSPLKSPPKGNSPNKSNETQNTPTKIDQPLSGSVKVSPMKKSPVKEPEIEKAEVLLSACQQEEMVDSSSKNDTQKSPAKSTSPAKTSPIKFVYTNKNYQSSPDKIKVAMSTTSTTETQSPGSIKSTQKESSDVTKMDVDKESLSQEVTCTIAQKETPSTSNETYSEVPSVEMSTVNGDVEHTCNKEDSNADQSLVEVVIIEKEASNDSQMEANFDMSEKDHNKSISRELKSLINSAKESKIISECTQLTSKTRKSRTPLDVSNTSLHVSDEADKINDKRRSSDNSQKSNCSEKSDKTAVKRSMRSQNPEFVNKVKQFLNSVTSKVQKESDEGSDDEASDCKTKEGTNEGIKDIKLMSPSLPKKKKTAENDVPEKSSKLRSDPYCWRCHWAVEQAPGEKTHPPMDCTVCPRAYHYKCLSGAERNKINLEKSWVCPECMGVLHAEGSETRSPAMKKISLGRLRELLKYAMERMMDLNGVEPFVHPVDRSIFPDYDKYVVHPMDLTQMSANIEAGAYGSTEAFIADAQWILHNSIIFNTLQSKLTAAARTLVRSCRAEMGEIEACPECYAAAHARRPTWFTDVCSTPHMLLWAKLKGFPYWPAKGMSVNSSGLVDVRFFGAHDRAWVPAKDCYLYSEKDPNNFRTKRQDILDSMQEAEQHIRNISRKYGKFVYPPFKTQFDPTKQTEQLKMMIPSFEGEVHSPVKDKPSSAPPSMNKDKSRSNSKSSKSSHNDGDTSEGEEAERKMADGAVIAREEEDNHDKSKTKDNEPQAKEESTRKRRRSELEEAVITIIECSKEKKRRVEGESEEKSEDVKTESQTPTGSVVEKEATVDETSKDSQTPLKKDAPSSTPDKERKMTPIRLVISTKAHKSVIVSKPTVKVRDKIEAAKLKQLKLTGEIDKDKNGRDEKKKRRNSKSNKSLNSSANANINKNEKSSDKKPETSSDSAGPSKETAKETDDAAKSKEDANKSSSEKTVANKETDSSKPAKDRIQFDDDTSLAVLAREVKGNSAQNNVTVMPTISSVRSLSTVAQNTTPTATKTTTSPKTIEVTIEANSDSSIFTPTSTDNVKSSKEAASKLQKLKANEPSMVGRVGVRAFARMTSPPPEPQSKKDDGKRNDVQVEIKAEPMDFEDADRQMEKMDLMHSFRLRPVVPPVTALRDVRMNKKVVVAPVNTRNKAPTKTPEVRPRARKTFPQPKKPEDGRSELNGKNSMVYIPIQPPVTPGPMRGARLTPVSVSNGTTAKTTATTSSANTTVYTTTATTSTVPSMPTLSSATSGGAGPAGAGAGSAVTSAAVVVPTVGHIPTTVHTVPLITSVNGQWTFSLQPIMSVGAGIDEDSASPIVNGLPDRNATSLLSMPALQPPASASPVIIPNALPASNLQPASNAQPASNLLNSSNLQPTSSLLITSNQQLASFMPAANVLPASNVLPAPNAIPASSAMPASSAPPLSAVSSPASAPNRTVDGPISPGEPPRLQQRPTLLSPLDSTTPVGSVPPPSSAGPVTAKINQNAVKLTDFFRTLLEDSLEKLDDPVTQLTSLKLQLEQARWRHNQEIKELVHNHELTLAELRSSFEKERARLTSELRVAAQAELESAVKVAKSKQWCANCSQEAQFYCCWNTSYCDYPCQRAHWSQHYAVCTQRPQDGSNTDNANSVPESRLQPQPDTLSKSSTSGASAPTPTLTAAAGTVPSPRVLPADQGKPSSIIMSMEKDTSGNSKLKCVGTYKPPAVSGAQTMSSIIINKQMLNDESAKKVVTSGGYLIVGASGNASPLVTPPRRAHIQYYT